MQDLILYNHSRVDAQVEIDVSLIGIYGVQRRLAANPIPTRRAKIGDFHDNGSGRTEGVTTRVLPPMPPMLVNHASR